jgi:two-component system NarL family response regulator
MISQLNAAGAGELFSGRAVMAETKQRTIRVMVVDSQQVVREGVAAIVGRASGMEVVAQAADGWRALELFRRELPDVVLTDLTLPGVDGIKLTAAITKERPRSRVIVLTTHAGREDIYRALQVGARSYLLKETSSENLIDAIRAVDAGHRLLSDEIATRLAERVSGTHLTEREMDVLRQIAAGRSNKEIALALGISESTVKGHVNNILSKMNVSDRTQAVTTALKHGLIRLE